MENYSGFLRHRAQGPRGQVWTLQEIIAPHQFTFYNKDWHPLTNFANDKIEHFDE